VSHQGGLAGTTGPGQTSRQLPTGVEPEPCSFHTSICVRDQLETTMSSLRLKPGDKKPPFSLSSPSGSSSSSSPSPANEPTPPTAAHSPEMMKVFGSKGLKNDVGIAVCPQCAKPVLKSAMGDHTGEVARYYAQGGRNCLWGLIGRDVQDDPNEWPCEERRACYASSNCGGYRFEWEHGTSSRYVHFDSARAALRTLSQYLR
jgi:hypothetical protein